MGSSQWIWIVLIVALSACADVTTQTTAIIESSSTEISPSGLWKMTYTGSCASRAPRLLDVDFDDKKSLLFDNYTLNQNDDGHYYANVTTTTFLESCQRDVVFVYEYDLVRDDINTYSGIESITEVGVGTETCTIVLEYVEDAVLEADHDQD